MVRSRALPEVRASAATTPSTRPMAPLISVRYRVVRAPSANSAAWSPMGSGSRASSWPSAATTTIITSSAVTRVALLRWVRLQVEGQIAVNIGKSPGCKKRKRPGAIPSGRWEGLSAVAAARQPMRVIPGSGCLPGTTSARSWRSCRPSGTRQMPCSRRRPEAGCPWQRRLQSFPRTAAHPG